MARARGRDVVLELMDAVGELEKTTALHATQLGDIAALAVETSAKVVGLSGQMGALTKGFADLSRRMDDMTHRMDDMTHRMDALTRETASLGADLTTQAETTLLASKTAHQQQQQLGRVARLLSVFADGSDHRFADIESRLGALEKKAS
jgi:chromosome segregation ATPase